MNLKDIKPYYILLTLFLFVNITILGQEKDKSDSYLGLKYYDTDLDVIEYDWTKIFNYIIIPPGSAYVRYVEATKDGVKYSIGLGDDSFGFNNDSIIRYINTYDTLFEVKSLKIGLKLIEADLKVKNLKKLWGNPVYYIPIEGSNWWARIEREENPPSENSKLCSLSISTRDQT